MIILFMGSAISSFSTNKEETVISSTSMKILGFVFGDKCGMAQNTEHICKKFSMRIWTLRHLKKAKMDKSVILGYYCTVIRPVIPEYAAQVYHFALTRDQSNRLEGLQRLASKIIYGFETSYRKAMKLSGLEPLLDRREKICLSFAKKCSQNPRYVPSLVPIEPAFGIQLEKPGQIC